MVLLETLDGLIVAQTTAKEETGRVNLCFLVTRRRLMRINRVKKKKMWSNEDFMVCIGLQLVVISLTIYQQVDGCEIMLCR
jgi:hypothetical protein